MNQDRWLCIFCIAFILITRVLPYFEPRTLKMVEVQSGVVPTQFKAEDVKQVHLNLKQRQCSINAPEEFLRTLDDLNYSCAIKNEAAFVAFKESTWNPNAFNRSSSASSYYQFLPSTFYSRCPGNIWNTYDQSRCALDIIAREGSYNSWKRWW